VQAKAFAAADREQYGINRPGDPCGGVEVRLVFNLVSSIADPGRSRHSPRSVHTGRLGAADGMVAEGAVRSSAANHPRPRHWSFATRRRCRCSIPGEAAPKICQFWAHAVDDRSWGGPSPPAVAYVFAPGRGKNEIAAQLIDFGRHFAGRRLSGLQVAGCRQAAGRHDPARLLPRACTAQVRYRLQGNESRRSPMR